MGEERRSPMCEMSEKLIEYLYHEMSASDASAFEAHLQSCARCARDVRDFQRVRLMLSEWQLAPPARTGEISAAHPIGFWSALRQLFRAMPRWGRVAIVGAAMLLLLALFNVRVEWTPEGGFRAHASLLPEAPFARPSSDLERDRRTLRALVTEMMREAEQRQRATVEARLDQALEHLRQEQRATLAEFAEALEAQHRAQHALLLRELERRRYGALTFADLFFNGEGN